MGKEKTVTNLTKPPSDLLFKITPLIIGFLSLAICYLLFKKIQTIYTQKDNILQIEKLINTHIQEQTELNMVNNKKLNTLMSQVNQISFLIQSKMERPKNSVDSQISPNLNNIKTEYNVTPPNEQKINKVITNESKKIKKENNESSDFEKPQVDKKENNESSDFEKPQVGKKIIDLEKLKEEVVIEEASSDDES